MALSRLSFLQYERLIGCFSISLQMQLVNVFEIRWTSTARTINYDCQILPNHKYNELQRISVHTFLCQKVVPIPLLWQCCRSIQNIWHPDKNGVHFFVPRLPRWKVDKMLLNIDLYCTCHPAPKTSGSWEKFHLGKEMYSTCDTLANLSPHPQLEYFHLHFMNKFKFCMQVEYVKVDQLAKLCSSELMEFIVIFI